MYYYESANLGHISTVSIPICMYKFNIYWSVRSYVCLSVDFHYIFRSLSVIENTKSPKFQLAWLDRSYQIKPFCQTLTRKLDIYKVICKGH